MNSAKNTVVVILILLIAMFHKYIPIRDVQFWVVIPMVYATCMFFFEHLYNVKEGVVDEGQHICAVSMLPIWGCLAIVFYNANKLPHAVICSIVLTAFLGVYLSVSFFHHGQKAHA